MPTPLFLKSKMSKQKKTLHFISESASLTSTVLAEKKTDPIFAASGEKSPALMETPVLLELNSKRTCQQRPLVHLLE
ncbi:hypothetical protein O9G_004054 [Rozella allomycis CSF55]|uniref:Uncharacterized protein n=1 Tax=Rozella allomycis (strain CSF55) TaxID=988480 RepID=A0A075B4A2_ROZAC|nr:hypothetical protein O9G_004054 [Rozella allomycis CSF55]|eukprot:EPZ36150.1 hypothetical protein O9G_004054 [Rozella allomycis CSF55]